MLTTDDRLAVQDLYARYNAYFDLGDHDNWCKCFVEDGVYAFRSDVRGRDSLAAMCEARHARRLEETWMNAQHWNSNLIVEGDSEHAKGMCYAIRVGKDKASGAFIILSQAMYQDKLAKVNGRWLFVRRDVHLDNPPPHVIPPLA